MIVAVACLFVVVTPAMAEESVDWQAPVDAPVKDPFRAPASPYRAGNRGLEYDLTEPTDVRAVDDGRVAFAGSVAGDLFVVVEHGNGLRSTLAYLDEILVVRGQHVTAGQVLAIAGSGFHLTARLGGTYLDPALLIGGAAIAVALVPGPLPAAPRAGIGEPALSRHVFDSPLAVIDSAEDLHPLSLVADTASAAAWWYHRECTVVAEGVGTTGSGDAIDLGEARSAENRLLIQVAGLGSSSASAKIGELDALDLGYDVDDVVGFSYAGGCTPSPFGLDDGARGSAALSAVLPVTTYGRHDTFADIESSASRLADLIDMASAARPGATIDIVAHSLGGVVTRRALELLDLRAGTGQLGTIMTIASPHQGADLATVASAAHGGLELADVAIPPLGELRNAGSVIQLSEVGFDTVGPAPPPPPGVSVVAVAGSFDPVVPALSATWEGASNVVVNTSNPLSAHADLPGNRQVRQAFLLARAGVPPACIGLPEVLLGAVAGAAVSAAEDLLSIATGIGRWLL